MNNTVYALTQWGKRAARSTMAQPTPAMRAVWYLDRVGHATGDQISQETGATWRDMATLREKRVVMVVA